MSSSVAFPSPSSILLCNVVVSSERELREEGRDFTDCAHFCTACRHRFFFVCLFVCVFLGSKPTDSLF